MKNLYPRHQTRDVSRDRKASSIDWQAVHHRIDSFLDSMRLPSKMPDEEIEEILKRRAADLAQETKLMDAAAGGMEILKFSLAYERYGLETQYINEVIPLKQFTPIPHTPDHLFGIINVRGRIVALVDLRRFFSVNANGITNMNTVIVLAQGPHEIGVLADEILGVETVALQAFHPPLSKSTGAVQEYCKGLMEDQTIVLDTIKLVSDSSMTVR